MLPSFFAFDLTLAPGVEFEGTALPESTRRHLRSRRIDTGEHFLLMNGLGSMTECEALDARGQRFRAITTTVQPAIEPRIEVCSSPPRGDALSELATQSTEIGAAALIFMRTDHNQIPGSAKLPPSERAQRVSDAACEQCARAWRMSVQPQWAELSQLVEDRDYVHVVADEALANSTGDSTADSLPAPGKRGYRLYLGPEGGWSANERQFFGASQVRRLSLGPLILRVPTAAVAGIYHLLRLSDVTAKR